MSALSLIGQFLTKEYPILAGGAGDGVQDLLITVADVPAGTYIGNVTLAVQGAGVTSGDFIVALSGVATPLAVTILGASNVQSTASATFFFTTDGTSNLTINMVGTGAVWTSLPSTLYLRQIA